MRKLSKLKKLSLINTENVKVINFDNLPRNLEALNFIACGLVGLRESIQISFLKPYKNIVHLCLAMNKLRSELTDEYLTIEYFPNLARFDFLFYSVNRYRRKRPKVDASLFDSAQGHTRRRDASEKKREENSVSTFGRFRLWTSFESSPVSVKAEL